MRIVGYGICGKGETKRYLKKTLDNFKRLCDEVVICVNGNHKEEIAMIKDYGFSVVIDDREWGKQQWKIKEEFLKDHVAPLNPDITVCLDMDEEFTSSTNRETLKEWFTENDTAYAYIANLWGKGYNKRFSFGNVRAWSWRNKEVLGKQFFEFEQKPVHCGLAPKWAYGIRRHAPFVVLHHGLKLQKDRKQKIERYNKYDKNQVHISNPDYYKELSKPNTKADKLDIKELEQLALEESKQLAPPPHIQPLIPKQKETIFVKRQHDGFVFTIEKERLANQLQQKYFHNGQQYGFELVE